MPTWLLVFGPAFCLLVALANQDLRDMPTMDRKERFVLTFWSHSLMLTSEKLVVSAHQRTGVQGQTPESL